METLNSIALAIGWIVLIFAGVPFAIYLLSRMYYDAWANRGKEKARAEEADRQMHEADWARKNPELVRRIEGATEAWMAEVEKQKNEEFKTYLAKKKA